MSDVKSVPYLIAANPNHYGRPFELSSVEAFASVLFMIGREDQALDILSLFKWGPHFLNLNKSILSLYKQKGLTSQAMTLAQKSFLRECTERDFKRKNRKEFTQQYLDDSFLPSDEMTDEESNQPPVKDMD